MPLKTSATDNLEKKTFVPFISLRVDNVFLVNMLISFEYKYFVITMRYEYLSIKNYTYIHIYNTKYFKLHS